MTPTYRWILTFAGCCYLELAELLDTKIKSTFFTSPCNAHPNVPQLKSLTHARLSGKVGASASGSGSRSSGESDSSESASVELTADSFDELVLQSKELWMVEFFAPW